MADLTSGTIPIATGTHQIDDGPLVEDGTGGLLLASPTGATTETYFGVVNGTASGYMGAIDGVSAYFSSFGVKLVLQSDTAVCVDGLADFADDVAAALGGVPVTGLYRTLSIVKVRVA